MAWFWFFQIVLDLLFLALFIYWAYHYWGRSEQAVKPMDENLIKDLVGTLEKRASIAEKKSNESRLKVEAQLKSLLKICDKANQAIEQLHLPQGFAIPTLEQEEILSVAKNIPRPSNPPIQSLEEVEEKNQSTLTHQSLVDLKSVLQGQLV